ncbi:Cyclin-T2 [Homalodisca vitripennis]|nr:Cyclin-T2 [Homalodisca vitripennis]
MEADEKWYFSKEQLANTPSRKFGYDADRELSCRQQAANFIQDMGQRLHVCWGACVTGPYSMIIFSGSPPNEQ